jgi:hypothetical protein
MNTGCTTRAFGLTVALLAAPSLAAPAVTPASYYVAPGGNDAWTGRLDAPNAARGDGPFATIERAREAVRGLRREQPNRTEPVTVLLRGGMYELAGTLRFTADDSGTTSSPTVFAAYPGETPVISGGQRLTGWKVTAEGRWELTVPAVAAGKWSFTQLFVNRERRYRPRWPAEGFSFIAAEAPPSPDVGERGYDRFHFREGDINPDWANLGDVELLTFHTWTMDRTLIASVDRETLTVQRSAPTLSAVWFFNLPKGGRFLCDNVKDALSKPGEWYLDRPTGVLTYIPHPGESPETAVVVAPCVDVLVRLEGDLTLGLGVENLRFEGLTFAYSNWVMTPAGNCWGQAEVGLPGAIRATGARNCTWKSCAITHVGTYGIELGIGCQGNSVSGCEITDLGAGGIRIGHTAYGRDSYAVASHNVVEDCLVAHGGRMHPAGIGVWIGHSSHNRISHNEVCDFYYSGFSVGWSWGYGPSHAHDNLIEFNEVHDIGQGVLSDMGGIYTLGVSPGTVIRGNRFHDVDAFGYGGWGIYLDEGSSGILAENNITYNTQSPGYRIHYGRDNTAVNNIFALSEEAPLGRARSEPHLHFTIERNLIYWERGQALGENWEGTRDNFRLDYNLYWCPKPNLRLLAGKTFEQWQASGQDTNSLMADPLFVDPAKGDFRLKDGSPAEKIGFKPIDIAAIGRLSAPGAPTPVAVPRAFPPPQVPGPLPIHADFEEQKVGDRPAGAQVIEENDTATIRVTEELAAGGRKCLKIVDVPGQKGEYNPHFFYNPNFVSGILRGSFDVWIDEKTYMYHEWRDYSTGAFTVGPAFHAMPDGRLLASGREVMRVSYGKWMHVEITCGLGPDVTGMWDLSILVEGEAAPRQYRDLPCSPGFGVLTWFGFTANADALGRYYLDNIRLGPLMDGT